VSDLLILFLNNLLPVFLAAGAGYLLSARLQVETRTLSRVIFYIFSPCLIFSILTRISLSDRDIFQMAAFTVITTLVLGLITWLVGQGLKLERPMLAAVLLPTMFVNAGNFGLPVVLFAFQETALAYASLFFVISIGLTYTLGVVIASSGTTSLRQSFANLLKVPTIYGMLLAIVFLRTGWTVPLPLARTAQLLGDASIPAMLILLGMQLRSIRWSGRVGPLALAVSMRLLVAPLLALWVSALLGLTGPARQAGVLEAAMPAAVLTSVLATEYQSDAAFVTAAVFVMTLLSPLTLTPLLAYLGA
jgi:predicted permease